MRMSPALESELNRLLLEGSFPSSVSDFFEDMTVIFCEGDIPVNTSMPHGKPIPFFGCINWNLRPINKQRLDESLGWIAKGSITFKCESTPTHVRLCESSDDNSIDYVAKRIDLEIGSIYGLKKDIAFSNIPTIKDAEVIFN